VDASENSDRALQVAAEMSKEYGAELHVFHAVSHHFQIPENIPFAPFKPINYPSTSTLWDADTVKMHYEAAGREILDRAKETIEALDLGPDLLVDYHLELEVDPADFAEDFATENGADLIVVGCKGHHGRLRRSLLGTVATRIVNEAPCQVLIVR
jgi:nucleotide-binding universal stress UspA family protein